MPNMLDVIRELKALQGKQSAGQATPADLAKIAELQDYMTGKKKPDAAPAGPPIRPPAMKPAAPAAQPSPPKPAAAAPPKPAAAPAAAAAPPRTRAPEPDNDAFALSLDADLMEELGGVDQSDDRSRAAATTFEVSEPGGDADNPFALDLAAGGIEPDDFETDAARTTFDVEEEPVAKASGANPFALEVPEGLDELDLVEDNSGNVTHELEDGELDGAAVDDDPYKVKLKDDFAKALDKSDGKGAGGGAPSAQMKGTPMVPDAHYEKLPAAETSVVVQLRDGRIGKGVAGAFSPMTPQFTLNQLVQGKPPAAIKLDECLTVRFVKAYNAGGAAATPFPAKPAPGPVTPGEKVQVQLLDGEKIIGTALAHKEGDSFMLVPVPGGNVKRMWISAKAVRAKTKLP